MLSGCVIGSREIHQPCPDWKLRRASSVERVELTTWGREGGRGIKYGYRSFNREETSHVFPSWLSFSISCCPPQLVRRSTNRSCNVSSRLVDADTDSYGGTLLGGASRWNVCRNMKVRIYMCMYVCVYVFVTVTVFFFFQDLRNLRLYLFLTFLIYGICVFLMIILFVKIVQIWIIT